MNLDGKQTNSSPITYFLFVIFNDTKLINYELRFVVFEELILEEEAEEVGLNVDVPYFPEGNQNQQLRNSQSRSAVWEHFDLNTAKTSAKCRLCQRVLTYRNSTGSLRNQITGVHQMVTTVFYIGM